MSYDSRELTPLHRLIVSLSYHPTTQASGGDLLLCLRSHSPKRSSLRLRIEVRICCSLQLNQLLTLLGMAEPARPLAVDPYDDWRYKGPSRLSPGDLELLRAALRSKADDGVHGGASYDGEPRQCPSIGSTSLIAMIPFSCVFRLCPLREVRVDNSRRCRWLGGQLVAWVHLCRGGASCGASW